MSDLIDRQAAIDEIDEWIKAFRESGHKQSAADARLIQDGIIKLPSTELGTNLAEVGTDCISRQAAIDAIEEKQLPIMRSEFLYDQAKFDGLSVALNIITELSSAQPEIIYCKDCKKQNRHYHESPYKDTVCPLTAWRGKAQGHEYDYQYCCYAERREVKT